MGKINDLANTIKECLVELERKEIGRAVILAQNFDGEKAGGFIDTQDKAYYHPITLPELEVKAKDQGENYQTIALVNGYEPRVLKNTPVNYMFQEKNQKEVGVEIITRNPTHTMGIDNFENNNYVNEWQFAGLENENAIKEIAVYLLDIGINSEEFKKVFNKGVEEYNNITLKLMEESGAIEAREKLEGMPIGAEKYLQEAQTAIVKRKILNEIDTELNNQVDKYKQLV